MYAEFDTTMVDTPFKVIEQENTAVNAALGLVFSPNERVKTYVNLSTGFRAPNIDDTGKFFDLPNDGIAVPNPDLKSEYAYNTEVGLAAIARKGVKFDISMYYTFLDDAMARGYDTFNGEDSIDFDGNTLKVYSVQNINSIWVAGIQAGVELDLLPKLSLKSSISYQKGKEKNPELDQNYSPTHVAPLFGSTHLVFSTGKFKADLSSIYNGSIAFDDLAFTCMRKMATGIRMLHHGTR
jgi:hemoglobin/transferrin/lactoferrin receptor protein